MAINEERGNEALICRYGKKISIKLKIEVHDFLHKKLLNPYMLLLHCCLTTSKYVKRSVNILREKIHETITKQKRVTSK